MTIHELAVWNIGTKELQSLGTGDVATFNGTLKGFGIDETPIGATTPASGAFTTLSASGNITLNGNNPLGTNNFSAGASSLDSVTSGQQNVAVGPSALTAITSANDNTALGFIAGSALVTGAENVFVGSYSGIAATASYNTAVGSGSLQSGTTGNYNTAIGRAALNSVTTGANNTAIGVNPGSAITAGSGNVIIGNYSGAAIAALDNNFVLADGTGNVLLTRLSADAAFNFQANGITTSGAVTLSGGPLIVGPGARYNSELLSIRASVASGAPVIFQNTYSDGLAIQLLASDNGIGGGIHATTGATYGIKINGTNNVELAIGGTTGATLTTAGLGLGVTPNAWGTFKAIDLSNSGAIAAFPNFGIIVARNAYYDGSDYRYKLSQAASKYEQDSNGVHIWSNASSGTAGDVISFTQAMTLGASGNLKAIGSPTFGPDSAGALTQTTILNLRGGQTAGDSYIRFSQDGVAHKAYSGWNNSASQYQIGNGGTIGTDVALAIDTNGNLILPIGDLIITAPTTPASASATGTVGTIAWDSSYMYVCVATDTWKRAAIATW